MSQYAHPQGDAKEASLLSSRAPAPAPRSPARPVTAGASTTVNWRGPVAGSASAASHSAGADQHPSNGDDEADMEVFPPDEQPTKLDETADVSDKEPAASWKAVAWKRALFVLFVAVAVAVVAYYAVGAKILAAITARQTAGGALGAAAKGIASLPQVGQQAVVGAPFGLVGAVAAMYGTKRPAAQDNKKSNEEDENLLDADADADAAAAGNKPTATV